MEKAGGSIPYKWVAMSVVAMGALMSTLDMGTVHIVLPHLEQVFHTGPRHRSLGITHLVAYWEWSNAYLWTGW